MPEHWRIHFEQNINRRRLNTDQLTVEIVHNTQSVISQITNIIQNDYQQSNITTVDLQLQIYSLQNKIKDLTNILQKKTYQT